MKRDYFLEILRSPRGVFTTSDVARLWGVRDMSFVRTKLHRCVKAGKLYSPRKGIYAKDRRYDRLELATRIFNPAYASLETVLAKAGMITLLHNRITVVSYLSRELAIDYQTYIFRKMPGPLLINHAGIDIPDNYLIASPERAFLDLLYLGRDCSLGYFAA